MGSENKPTLTDAQVKEIAAPIVQIVVDEARNEMRRHIDEVAAKTQSQEARAGNPLATGDVRSNPNFRRWVDGQGGPGSSNDGNGPIGSMPAPMSARGLGAAFVTSEEFGDFRERRKLEGQSLTYRMKSFFDPRATAQAIERNMASGKTAGITTVSDMQGVLSTYYDQDIVALPQRQIRTRDLFEVVPTADEAVKYIRQTGFSNNAAPVAMLQNDPATAIAAPMSTLTYTLESAYVREIAHWVPAPRQLLVDVDRLATEIDRQMKIGLMLNEDVQLLYGDGTGNNVQGLLTDANVQSYNWSDGDVGDNIADAILGAIVKAWLSNYIPDGGCINPQQWATVVKAKDSLGRYLLPDGFRTNLLQPGWAPIPTLTIWDIPFVRTTAMSTGAGVIGAFKTGATLYDRQDATMRITDSHADFFLKGIQVCLAEERVALAVKRPESFVAINFDNTPTA